MNTDFSSKQLTRDIRATLMPGFLGYDMPTWVTRAFDAGLQSVCVYGNNVESGEQLRRLGRQLRAAAPHAILAIDEEGGEVTRLHYLEGSPYPGAAVMGRIDDIHYTEEIGARVARDILDAGFNLALAPDADVNSNPSNPVIGTRSFGAAPDLASRHVAAWVRGLVGAGAIACPKHFPGHGDTSADSHLALPVVHASHDVLAQRDLPPFRAAFDAGAQTVMTSHILLPEIDASGPATFSSKILQGLLRDELRFTGVIVSDALDMQGASSEIGIPEAAVRALAAGCDLLCTGVDTTEEEFEAIVAHVHSAIAEGRVDAARIADAARRVRELGTSAAPVSAFPVSTAEFESANPSDVSVLGTSARHEIHRILSSFNGLADARQWIASHPRPAIMRVETAANMAVGFAPWGPFAHPSAFKGQKVLVLDSDTRMIWPLDELAQSGTVVIGRDMHQREFVREAIDGLRAAGVPVLAVEMGWPGIEPGYADLATHGSSALVGEALLAVFEDAVRP